MNFSGILDKLRLLGVFDEKSIMDDVDTSKLPTDRDEFKRRISGVESNFGQNLNHPTIQSGIHAGDSAIGEYAMMPNTIQEFANRMGNSEIANIPKEQYPEYFKQHPDEYNKIANYSLDQVFDKFNHDPEMAAYAWNQGHNLSPEKITPKRLNKSPYVQKFRSIKTRLP
jgi:hypothetical protein